MTDLELNKGNEEHQTRLYKMRWISILLIGCLSMFMAEVFAGSSQMWFIDPWSLIVTYPLYLAHLLFFLNLSIKTRRTSIPQLYLWGVLFALYEAWITKVLWFGYPGSEGPVLALVGGIAVFEFSTLVFFWHPVLAFVMPILVFESFTLSQESNLSLEERIFPSHLPYLKKDNKRFLYFCVFIIILGSAFLSINTGFNILVVIIAISGSIGLIFLFYYLIKQKAPNSFSIYSLKLGKKGLSIVVIYLVALYVITFIFLLPERIPSSILPILIIIGFYGFIGLTLKVSKPSDEIKGEEIEINEIYSANFFFKLFGLLLVLGIIFCLVPIIGILVALPLFIGLFLMGPVFFAIFLYKNLKQQN
ncbi:MAG: hypothetical protein EU539_09680 [Promethearchaeota archaeon]|nr:MAG: hypothetical protein EU539_09680 [Candidatus Lokiarchaeota archaeon]